MGHPLAHAQSSWKKYKVGNLHDHFIVHSIMDSSKGEWADFRHRTIFHQTWGAEVVGRAFANQIDQTDTNGDFLTLPKINSDVARIAICITKLHIEEDLGRLVNPEEWYNPQTVPEATGAFALYKEALNKRSVWFDLAETTHRAAERFGGVPEDYTAIEEMIRSRQAFSDSTDWRALALCYHSRGIFIMEMLYGAAIRHKNGRLSPLRPVLEWYLVNALGAIPPTSEVVKYIRPQRWMYRIPRQPEIEVPTN